jgi:hypothetical protein
VDVVRSEPAGIDRGERYRLRVAGREFAPLFDGTERLVGLTVNLRYVRRVFGAAPGS